MSLVPPGVELTAALIGPGRRWEQRPGERFRAASVTKTFVAATALLLSERHELDLADPVAELLDPALVGQLAAAGYDPSVITVEHLLGHRSALRDHSSTDVYLAAVQADPGRVWTRAEQVAIGLAAGGPLGPVGAAVNYSDTGYLLVGDVLERVTGRPLGELVEATLELPGRAPDTCWERAPVPEPRFPQRVGELSVWSIHPSVDLFGGGGLVTTAWDLAAFGRDLLGGRVLPPAALRRMLDHGLGIMRAPGEPELWGHLGFWGTAMLASPDGIGIGLAVTPAPVSGGPDPGRVALALRAQLV